MVCKGHDDQVASVPFHFSCHSHSAGLVNLLIQVGCFRDKHGRLTVNYIYQYCTYMYM